MTELFFTFEAFNLFDMAYYNLQKKLCMPYSFKFSPYFVIKPILEENKIHFDKKYFLVVIG